MPAPCEPVADGPHDAFFLGRLQDVIVLDVIARRLEIAIALGMRALIALVEQEEFEFGGHIGLHLVIGEALELLLQDGARRMRNILMCMVIEDIADARALYFSSQGIAPQGRHIGLEHEIAIALVPADRLVARYRLHLDVVAEEIIAAMRLFIGAVGEILRVEPLADEPSLHVDHAGRRQCRSVPAATSFLSSASVSIPVAM